jgi:hypothetical protein
MPSVSPCRIRCIRLFPIKYHPPMSKCPCSKTPRRLADSSPTVHRDAAWRALYAAYHQWFEWERDAKRAGFRRISSGGTQVHPMRSFPCECPCQPVLQVSLELRVELTLDEEVR